MWDPRLSTNEARFSGISSWVGLCRNRAFKARLVLLVVDRGEVRRSLRIFAKISDIDLRWKGMTRLLRETSGFNFHHSSLSTSSEDAIFKIVKIYDIIDDESTSDQSQPPVVQTKPISYLRNESRTGKASIDCQIQ